MNKIQKQDLFNAISKVGYKETETILLCYLDGQNIDISDDIMTILCWFNVWYNKGVYDSDTQSVVSFIQSNTYTNPKKNNKKVRTEITDDFKKAWKERFGVDVVEDSISVNVKRQH